MRNVFMAAIAATTLFASPAFAALIVNGGTIGQSVIVTSTDDVIARFEESDAGLTSELYLSSPAGFDTIIFNNHTSPVGGTVNLGSFAVGTELIFKIHVFDDPEQDFFTGEGTRNVDGFAHAAVNFDGGRTWVGFEDLSFDPDGSEDNGDYNDLIFSFSNTGATNSSGGIDTGGPDGVPEPATWGLMILGIGGVGAMLRRRRPDGSLALLG